MSADKEKYEREAAEWLAHMQKDYLPVEFEASLGHFREKILLGGLTLTTYTTGGEIEALRSQKYMNVAKDIMVNMLKYPEPKGSPVDTMRKNEFNQILALKYFKEEDVRRELGQSRATDELKSNHPTVANIHLRARLLKKLAEEIGAGAAQHRIDQNEQVILQCLADIKRLHVANNLDVEAFERLMRFFRKAVYCGFPKEDLQGGTWFDLEKDFKITHQELRDLDPRNKNKKLV